MIRAIFRFIFSLAIVSCFFGLGFFSVPPIFDFTRSTILVEKQNELRYLSSVQIERQILDLEIQSFNREIKELRSFRMKIYNSPNEVTPFSVMGLDVTHVDIDEVEDTLKSGQVAEAIIIIGQKIEELVFKSSVREQQ